MTPLLTRTLDAPRVRHGRHFPEIVVSIVVVFVAAGCGNSSSPPEPPTSVQPATPPVSRRLPRSTNSLGMQFVQLPAGEFEMGSFDSDDLSDPDEKPVHKQKIASAFWLGAHEVTRGQYRKFAEATGYQTAAEKSGEGGFAYNAGTQRLEPDPKSSWRRTGFEQDDSHPAVNLNWDDAQAFCVWLSGKEKTHYRLPTEVEWEYACRAGSTTRWSYGSQQECLVGMANICDTSLQQAYPFAEWSMTWNDGYAFTSPVGSFPANSFDLFDMHGNVFEWCADDWKGTDYSGHLVPDPATPDITETRIVRGGSYLSLIMFTRSADRVGLKASQRNAITGFRVVKDTIADTVPAGKKIHE